MSGATFVANGLNYKTVTVKKVETGSAAEAAGLKQNDTIETVDGKAVETLAELKQMFRRDGSQYSLGVRRGTEPMQLTIKLHRLI